MVTAEDMMDSASSLQTRRGPAGHHEHTYFALRWAIWFGGLLFLALLPALSCVSEGACIQISYSYYYHVHDWTRNIFVGFLFAIGTSLYVYKGFDQRENVLLNIAGMAAYAIALFPTRRVAAAGITDYEIFAAYLHNVAAGVFFVCIAYVAVRPQVETEQISKPSVVRFLRRRYRFAALMMLLGTAFAVVFSYVLGRFDYRVFMAELVAILAFSFYWLAKNIELRYSQADHSPPTRKPMPLLTELVTIAKQLWPFGKKTVDRTLLDANQKTSLRQLWAEGMTHQMRAKGPSQK